MTINKHQTNSSHFKLATLGAMLILSACTNTEPMDVAKAADTPATPEESFANEDFPGWRNPFLARAAKYAGQALIADLNSAQKALDLNDVNQANHYLDAAEDLAEGIRTMMPFSVTIDEIRDAKGNINVNADLFETDTMLPIYQSLEELDVYSPEVARQSRAKVHQSEQLAKSGKKRQAIDVLDQVEADLAASTVYMPVITVSQHIENAMTALEKEPVNKVEAQEQIDMALSSMVDETRSISVTKQRS